MKVLKKARKDPRIQNLLDHISGKVKIKYKKSHGDGWSSSLTGDVALIEYSGCRHPSASLAHELLHMKLQLAGFRQLLKGISSLDQTPVFAALMECLNNELQHQKFYEEFIQLGFKQHQFYRDSDESTGNEIREEINNGIESPTRVIINAMTLLSPGGLIEIDEHSELWKDLSKNLDGAYENALNTIKIAVQEWRCSEELNQEAVIREIFLAMQPEDNLTWFGYSKDADQSVEGFFVDKEFQVIPPGG